MPDRFFRFCLRNSWEELTDLVFRRYHDPSSILYLEAEEGIALLLYAMETEETDRLFSRWINGYQTMGFDEFRAALTPVPDKPAEEILEDVGDILQTWEVRRNGNL